MVVGYALRGRVMVLNAATSDMLDERHDARERLAVEREIRCDAQVLANSLGREITVETSNGIEVRRLGATASN